MIRALDGNVSNLGEVIDTASKGDADADADAEYRDTT
jgi:hypothetical protein